MSLASPVTCHLLPTVSRADAIHLCTARRFQRLGRRPLPEPVAEGERGVPQMSVSWLPHYLIRFNVRNARGDGGVWVSVESYTGAYAFWAGGHATLAGPPPGEHFAPRLAPDVAAREAEKQLAHGILLVRGERLKPIVTGLDEIRVLHYPYWIYLYERHRGRLDRKSVV